jgi:hypothetical protein
MNLPERLPGSSRKVADNLLALVYDRSAPTIAESRGRHTFVSFAVDVSHVPFNRRNPLTSEL